MLSRGTGESGPLPGVDLMLTLGRVYVPAIFVLNKIDAISIEELDLLYKVS
jgi:ribosome-interacting GTPase 1